MRFSQLFTKTLRQTPAEERSANTRLLTRGGFVFKNLAGVYSLLPLGVRVIRKIERAIREEMNVIGAQELHLNVLQDKKLWEKTGRWQEAKEVMYQFRMIDDGREKKEDGRWVGLGFTHEEVIAQIASQYVHSYKDLPKYLYQIQVKFRNEPRPQAGLLRGREFPMKDLYSLTANDQELDRFYETVAASYLKIFKRLGLEAIRTKASGGLFSKYSDEFQVISEVGEDTIFVCPEGHCAVNKEVISDVGKRCPDCRKDLTEQRAIEVGNIFKLGTRFSEPLGLRFTDRDGSRKPVVMGSYGIGTGRAMAAIVEVHHDEKGIIWPASVAPFIVHLINLKPQINQADRIYDTLARKGIEVLYDDRADVSPGEKFADCDLIGCPYRLVVSAKTGEKVELKQRREHRTSLKTFTQVVDLVSRK